MSILTRLDLVVPRARNVYIFSLSNRTAGVVIPIPNRATSPVALKKKELIRMSMKVTVSAGPHDRYYSPVSLSIPNPGNAQSAILTKITGEKKKEIPPPPIVGQLRAANDGSSILTFIVPWIPKNAHAAFAVELSGKPASNGTVLDTQQNGDVEIAVGGQRLGKYHADKQWVRPFIEPLMGPFGHSVTRGWPSSGRPNEAEDHPHHKSLWIAHGDVNGVDNWSESDKCGRQVQREVIECSSGAVTGVLKTRNDWVGNDGVKVIEDTRTLTFYSLPEAIRMIDVEVEFHATEGPVVFGDTKEGGILSVRVATPMDVPRTGRITNAEGGSDESETWGKRSAWCDYSGLDEGGNIVGVAVFNDPKSNRYPTYWHVRNYGLMTANPYGLHDFYADDSVDGSQRIEAGQKLWFGYRVYVHAGDAEGAHVGEMYHSFVNPPKASVEAD